MSPCFSSYCRVHFPRSVPYGSVKYQLWFVILIVGLVLVCVFPQLFQNCFSCLDACPLRPLFVHLYFSKLTTNLIYRITKGHRGKRIYTFFFFLLPFFFFFFFFFTLASLKVAVVIVLWLFSHNPFSTFNLQRRKPLVITDFAWHSSLLAPTPVTIQDAEVFEVR